MSTEDTDNKDPNRTIKAWAEISDRTGIKFKMVRHIHRSIIRERKKEVKVNSKNASNLIIIDLLNNDNGAVKNILSHNGITSSNDFGNVIRLLCEKGLLLREEGDDYDDFNGLFNLDTIEEYIIKNNLTKDRDWFKIISNSFYYIGCAIVVLSYSIQIPNKFGLMGWIIGMIGWILLTFKSKIESKWKEILNKMGITKARTS
ncbi:MAG: hypothetical protein U0Y96_15865 [Candidatus Kapaibacterium sp.]|nr:hypothetical protein [Bacteroidota bacterium]